MATFVHGKNTYISVATFDMSAYTTKSEFKRTADVHDNTAYGATWKAKDGGLLEGMFSMEGIYDSTTSGPHDKLLALVGTKVAVVRRVEGTGTGKPGTTFTGVMASYVETSAVNDMVKWSIDIEVDGAPVEADQ